MLTFRSPNTHSTAEYLSNLYSRPVVLEPKSGSRIDAEVASLLLGRTRLTSISYGSSIRLSADYRHSANAPGSMMMMLCFKGNGIVEVDRQTLEIDIERALLAQPREVLSGEYSDDCERLIVRLPRGVGIKQSNKAAQLDLTTEPLDSWLTQVRTILSSASMMSLLKQNEAIALTMERLLSQLLKSAEGQWNSGSSSAMVEHVLLAENYIERNFDQSIGVSDVALELGIPVRTLQHYFRQARNYSPTEYLHRVRLEKARDLLTDPQLAESVTDVALACGFNHLSRFAQAYLERFAEHPSATLKKHSKANDADQ